MPGQTLTVYAFNGNSTPTSQQSGFTLNTTGLVAPESYSVDFVSQLTQRDGAWRRLIDVQNRQSDNGFYVDPTDNLDIYPVSGSTAAWTNNAYHHIVLTDNGTQVSVCLDGISQFTATTNELNLDFDPTDNPNQLMGFFLDNVVAGGQGEYSSGTIASLRLWNGVLSPAQAEQLAALPPVPEPATAGVMAFGLMLLGRRNRKP